MSAYEVVKVEGHGMSLDSPRFGDTVCFKVKHIESGDFAWSSNSYWANAGARSIQGLRLQASNMCKRYEAHLKRTGSRFEVTEREERAAKHLAKKTADRLAWLEKWIPLYQAELKAGKGGAVYDLKLTRFPYPEHPNGK